jgi:hypothetical protein
MRLPACRLQVHSSLPGPADSIPHLRPPTSQEGSAYILATANLPTGLNRLTLSDGAVNTLNALNAGSAFV